MSDHEEKPAEEVEGEGAEGAEEEVEVIGEETPEQALRTLITQAQNCDTLFKGLHECCRQIEKGKAALCILATDCDSDQYKNLVTFLCKEKDDIPLYKIDSREKLGEFCGLCRYDEESQEVRRVRKTSVAVIKRLPTQGSTSTKVVLDYIQNEQDEA